MRANTVGAYNVKFGPVSEVHAAIDAVLDGKQDKKPDGNLHVVDNKPVEKPNS